ncbi:MAG: RyR domain-containing protein [Gaiellales bacterium]
MARAIHVNYRRDQADRKPADDPAMAAWDELPEHLRESNRHQADHMFEKLDAIGCTVQEAGDGGAELFAFTKDEIELMSEMEHDRWTAERLADGWTLGEERDVLNKIHPGLVSWEELSEEVREWDREPVRRIPELLAGVGFEIRRQQGPYEAHSR